MEVNSPRQAIRAAYDAGLLEDIDLWFEFLEDRNLASHTYDESTATQVYESAVRLPAALRSVIERIKNHYLC
ncbi:hypothetical protein MHOCP_07410 [Moorella humiferrea]